MTIRAESAYSFVNALSPLQDGIGGEKEPRTRIYRGHANASWPLLASARRPDKWPLPMAPDLTDSPYSKPDIFSLRIGAEVVSLFTFALIADRRGHAIPNLGVIKSDKFDRLGQILRQEEKALKSWPPLEFLPALALAQHHGLPTSLLDFTWDPYVAAYFAARGHMKPAHDSAAMDMCVWIVSDEELLLNGRGKTHRIQLVVPPASDNHTLQAQEGVFLYSPLDANDVPSFKLPFDPGPPIESCLAEHCAECIVKIVVTATAARDVMRLLIKLGYDSSRLFPTYEGAVKAVDDWNWANVVAFS